MVADRTQPVWALRDETFVEAHRVLGDERVGHRHDLRCRAVVLVQENGFRPHEALVEIEQVLHVCPTPRVDGLVGVSHDEEIAVVGAQHLHELVLKTVDVLELVDHDVLEALLPFELHALVQGENVQRELDEVVVVKREALLLLVQIPVEDDVLDCFCLHVLLVEQLGGKPDHILVIGGPLEDLHDLDHVARLGKRHVAQRQAALVVDGLQHRVDVGVIEHEKALGVRHDVGVLVQHRDAKAVKRVDEAGVVITRELVYALAHLASRLIGKGHAQDVARQDAQLFDQVGEAMRERPRLARAGAGDDAHVPFRRGHGLELGVVESDRVWHAGPSSIESVQLPAYHNTNRCSGIHAAMQLGAEDALPARERTRG